MVRIFTSLAPVVFVSLLLPVGCHAQGTPARDWLTWGYDQERTGWNKGETTLSKDNVGRLELRWSTQLSTQPKDVVLSTLTAPVVVEGVNTSQGKKNLIFLVGSDDTVFALDADTGKTLWQKTFPQQPDAPAGGHVAMLEHAERNAGN
jgi:glucose dehydrogenase